MKILVTGGNGQLGRSLQREFASHPEHEVVFTDVDTLDLTNMEALTRYIDTNDFALLINCAAYTAVDRAENDDLTAARINTEAVGNIARAAADKGIKVIHISTDYVFSGESYRPYVENDEPDPHSIYGRTKLQGEGLLNSFCPDAVIIRTAWLYSEFGSNFVKTMLRLAHEGKSLRVVADQIGTPTYAGDLARAIIAIADYPEWKPGTYHFTDEGVASWYDFAMAILENDGFSHPDVTPVSTRDYPTPASRPHYSVLDKSKIKSTFSLTIPYWRDSLRICQHNMQ